MDGSLLDIAIFLLATFVGALIAGVTGFAFGLVVAALWLHILTPIQTATLIIAFGLIVQGYAVIRLRRAIKWQRLWPFILGAAFGVPAGVAVLGWADPAHVRAATARFSSSTASTLCCVPPSSRWSTAAPRRTRASASSTGCSAA